MERYSLTRDDRHTYTISAIDTTRSTVERVTYECATSRALADLLYGAQLRICGGRDCWDILGWDAECENA